MFADRDRALLRYSLVAVWLATAFASVWELHGQSAGLLKHAGIEDPVYIGILILGGAAFDAVMGVAMLVFPRRITYLLALAGMVVMTGVGSLLDPSLWLHPLGPLTKNLPIAAALLILARKPA